MLSTVGPYARHGTPLVAACAEAGSDYADLSAEPVWMRRTVDRFHARAQRTGARLVPACGFDALPSDLGTWLLQRVALERHGRACHRVTHLFGPLSPGLSGGTLVTSLAVVADAARDAGTRRALADPDLLAPGSAPSPAPRDPWWPQREPTLRAWTAPFLMSAVNAKVVRRTRALLGEPWGTDFRYRERLRAAHPVSAAALGAATRLAPAALAFGPLRRLVRWLGPKPGSGPSDAQRARGAFRTALIGYVEGAQDPVVARVEADLDPGYGATARMLAEVGLALANEEPEAPGGVLTPAFVGGMGLVERLAAAGIRLRVDAQPPP